MCSQRLQEEGKKNRRATITGEQATRPSKEREERDQSVRVNPEAMAIFEFLGKSHPATPAALAMFQMANGKPWTVKNDFQGYFWTQLPSPAEPADSIGGRSNRI